MTAFTPLTHQQSSSLDFTRPSSFSSVGSENASAGVRTIPSVNASSTVPQQVPVRVFGIASLLLGNPSLQDGDFFPVSSEEGRAAHLKDMDTRLAGYGRDAKRASYAAQSIFINAGMYSFGREGSETPLFSGTEGGRLSRISVASSLENTQSQINKKASRVVPRLNLAPLPPD